MIVDTIAPAPILLFNKEHRNFTESDTYIDANTPIEGEPKLIEGKRKGQPFTYRLFITNDKQIIFLNKTNYKDMNTTEVQLGADASKSTPSTAPSPIKQETTINLPNNKVVGIKTITWGLVGAGAGYTYCKYKKHDNKTTMYYAIGGALIGGLAGYLLENNVITIKKGN